MENKNTRYELLDTIRGLTLLSMIVYHASWDLVYVYNINWPLFVSVWGHIWQQSICWTFILLSGFCFSLGKKKLKRGLVIFGAGALITIVSLVFTPNLRILFGVLTLTGSCMLIMIPLSKILPKKVPVLWLFISFLLFFITRNVPTGTLGFEGLKLLSVPRFLYANLLTAYFGFPPSDFFSTDYFSIIPWIFHYITGYYLYLITAKKELLSKLSTPKIPILNYIGKHTLIIYLVHQPLIYLILIVLRYFHLL